MVLPESTAAAARACSAADPQLSPSYAAQRSVQRLDFPAFSCLHAPALRAPALLPWGPPLVVTPPSSSSIFFPSLCSPSGNRLLCLQVYVPAI